MMKIRNRLSGIRMGGLAPILSGLAAVLLCCSVPAWATTVSGTVKLPDGTLVNGTIEFILSQQATTITPPVLFAPVKTTCAVSAGAITACTVQGNDTLDPAGTFYKVRIVDQRNIIIMPETKYTISGASVDLGTLPPTATATLVPPTGSVTGNMNVTGNLTVGGTVTAASISPGAAGSTTQVQFNNAGLMAGDPEFTFTPATNTLTTDTQIVGKWNNIRVVDGVKFTTIQLAVTDFGAVVGLVLVPSSYAGAEPTSVPNNVTILDLRSSGALVLGGNTISFISAGNRRQLVIAPFSTAIDQGVAAIDLVPNNPDRNAIIRFYPERGSMEDVTMQAHKLVGAATHQHWQIHTKDAAGTAVLDRFFIEYLKDSAAIQISNGFLQVDDANGYVGGTSLGNPMPFKSNIHVEATNPFVRFKQPIDGLNSSVGRLETGGPVSVRSSTGSDAIAGFKVEKADGTDLFVVDAAGVTELKRVKASKGTALVAGDFALTGWGISPTVVVATNSRDQNFEISITAGTTPGTNPTATFTFKDLTFTTAPAIPCSRNDTLATAGRFAQTTLSATAPVFTFVGTPVAAEVYKMACSFVGN